MARTATTVEQLHERLTRMRKRHRRLMREMQDLGQQIEQVGWDVADAVLGPVRASRGGPHRIDVETGRAVDRCPVNGYGVTRVEHV